MQNNTIWHKLFIASDHTGIAMKAALIHHLKNQYRGDIQDLGPKDEHVSVDYPRYAEDLAQKIHSTINYANGDIPLLLDNNDTHSKETTEQKEKVCGILICGSGIGMSIAANRFLWIRAALCYTEEHARLAREHNNANVLVLGAKLQTIEEVKIITDMFFTTRFSALARHEKRIVQLAHLK
jgi:ribose 5-phosphate isomerase B